MPGKIRLRSLCGIALFGLVLIASGAAAADNGRSTPNGEIGPDALTREPLDHATSPQIADGRKTDAFGVLVQRTSFHASRWVPWDTTANPDYLIATGYLSPGTTGDNAFWVQIDLPLGAEVQSAHAMVLDNDGTGWSYFTIDSYEAGSGTDYPVFIGIANGSTTPMGTPGYTTIDLSPTPFVIRGFFDLNSDGTAHQVAFCLGLNILSVSLPSENGLFGAWVEWKRTISPAPAVATFADVPVGAFGFQHVEALAASGITGGCGGGNYCPNQPLTRVQMAVFLAKALGLHWAD